MKMSFCQVRGDRMLRAIWNGCWEVNPITKLRTSASRSSIDKDFAALGVEDQIAVDLDAKVIQRFTQPYVILNTKR